MSHIATIATIIAIKLPHSYHILLMLLLILFIMDTVVVMVFGQVVLFVSMSVSMQLRDAPQIKKRENVGIFPKWGTLPPVWE